MPQFFHVLKCFKCSVFQVHQTKKTNKWQCKVCGEKQSIKRHYGLGTGKECRLHVQRLNELRGEIDYQNECINLNKSSEEEIEDESKPTIFNKKTKRSKWLSFTKEVIVQSSEENESMCLGNVEVVLEVPVKKSKKFKPPKPIVESTPLLPCYESIKPVHRNSEATYDGSTCISNSFFKSTSMSTVIPAKIIDPENKLSLSQSKIQFTNTVNETQSDTIINDKNYINTIHEPPKVNKYSKWAAYAEEEPDDNPVPVCRENTSENIATSQTNLGNFGLDKQKSSQGISTHLFALCDDSELDELLEF